MSLGNLTDRNAVHLTIDEYDRTGRVTFPNKHGFEGACEFYLAHDGKTYDSRQHRDQRLG